MSTVRTHCPSCQIITVDAMQMVVRRRADASGSEAVFECPACASTVVQAVDARMVPVLIGAGCEVEDWEVSDARALHPSQAGGAITEAEITRFVASLERRDWPSYLEH